MPPTDDRGRARARLPAPLSSFVGRGREAAAAADLLHRADVRLVILTGPGGVGKSRLALHAASLVADGFADGAYSVDLSPLAEPAIVLPAVAGALRVREAGDRALAECLARAVADRNLLLVADGLEQVLDAVPFLAALLAACPGVKLLTTSRVRLRASGGHVVVIPPLALPDPTEQSLDEVRGAGAVRLFVARTEAAWAGFALTPDNAPAVAELCRWLDGLSLAIELAAWVAHLPPADLLDRLESNLPLLTGDPRDAPARLRTVRDAIAWSHDLLTPEAQVLFCRLSVFVGGFDLEAARAVSGGDLDALTGIASLVDASLLGRVPGPSGATRFAPLEMVREFARERLAAAA